jgi:chemotaxis protein histidine kinase CheA
VLLDEEQIATPIDRLQDEPAEGYDESLMWLLEKDLSDPAETLFTLVEEDFSEPLLTESETEVAGRPMVGEAREGGDISDFLEEEIVMTSVGASCDIYREPSVESGSIETQTSTEQPLPLPIYHAENRRVGTRCEDAAVVDGMDILGPIEDDETGQCIAIQNNRREAYTSPRKPKELASTPESQPEVDIHPLIPVGSIDTDDVSDAGESRATSGDICDYIARTRLPVDEAEFDEYLLHGQYLNNQKFEVDDLLVQVTEGIASVDPSTDIAIDYHPDFCAPDEFEERFVGDITAVIGMAMEEITDSIEAQRALQAQDVGTIYAEFMLGFDAESTSQCTAEGYAPLAEVCLQQPRALLCLQQEQLDAIYIRLSHAELAGNWNHFLINDHATRSSEEDAEGADVEGTDILPLEAEKSEEEVGFDEDIFSIDLSDELTASSESDYADLDELLESLAGREEDCGDICGVAVDEFQEEVTVPSQKDDSEPTRGHMSRSNPTDMSWCIPADIAFNHTSRSGAEIFADFLDSFIEEGACELEKLEDAIGEWEDDAALETAYANIPRILHNLKGIAKGVGLQCYGTLIHNFETLLDAMMRPQAGEEEVYFQIVNVWLDAAVRGFEHIQDNRTDVESEFPKIGVAPQAAADSGIARISDTESTGSEKQAERESTTAPEVSKQKAVNKQATSRRQADMRLADEGAKALAAPQSIRMTSDAIGHLMNLTNEVQQLGVRSSQSTVKSKRAATELQARLKSFRTHIASIADKALRNVTARGSVSTSAMDALEMDQYSELQEAANILREGVEDLDDLICLSSRQSAASEALLKQQASVISSLSASIQAARVVPVSRLMPSLRRIVRTVGADLGKEVAFRVHNQMGALDRDNYTRCQTILEHMVRNALDHGIELPEERVAATKSAIGRISVDVRKEGADYIITLEDDGRGIDPDTLRETAFQKGLDIEIDALSDDEARRLIFHRGLTTANTLSEISGRGVGMEIVLNELQQMGGDIEIESELGQGTTFRIRIPSNVTVNGALLVTAGAISYAIPLDGLIAVEHVAADTFFDAVAGNHKIDLFGMQCDPTYLATLCHGRSLPERSAWGTTVPVMIAGSEDRYMAVAIDDVKQALELVIRSLGMQFSTVPGVAGGATTAEGEAIVALDVNALVGAVTSHDLSIAASDRGLTDRMLVLVVDDSRTQRMVATSQFDTLGVETITAENGMVAMDLLNSGHKLPDVILLDVEMPVKDGIQTLREIRKSRRYSDIPVIMVTSRTGAKHRALAKKAGCNGYMGKPFNFPVLVEEIVQLTGRDLQLS